MGKQSEDEQDTPGAPGGLKLTLIGPTLAAGLGRGYNEKTHVLLQSEVEGASHA